MRNGDTVHVFNDKHLGHYHEFRTPKDSPNFTFCPFFILKSKSFGASNTNTIVDPRLNSPNASPLAIGMPGKSVRWKFSSR